MSAEALTAEPFAIANGLPYNLVASSELFAQNTPARLSTQASGFFFTGGRFSNQKVLLAWEHNHISGTVNALAASYFPNGGGQVLCCFRGTRRKGGFSPFRLNQDLARSGAGCQGWPQATALAARSGLELTA